MRKNYFNRVIESHTLIRGPQKPLLEKLPRWDYYSFLAEREKKVKNEKDMKIAIGNCFFELLKGGTR